MPKSKAVHLALAHKAHRRIDRLKSQLLDFTRQFCRIATVNPPGDRYLECVRFLDRKLRALGLRTRILRVPRAVQARLVPGLDAYPRYNLVARWDVGAKKTLHFSGHYDVVPPTSGWKSDPFAPFRRGEKLIGRGSVDMKSCDAAAIFAVQALQESGLTPPWNLELSFTADEETGGYAGLGWLVKSKALRPDAAVLLEGGEGDTLGYAHRGVLWLKITVLGKPGHAATPKNGINALEKACGLIRHLKTLESRYARRRTRFLADAVARRPTLMIGGVSGGGGKVNTIPDRFQFSVDRRLLPEEKLSEVKAELMRVIRQAQRKDKKLKVQVEYPLYVAPGWTPLASPLCRLLRQAHRAVTGRRSRFHMNGGFTDMHWLNRDARIPTVGYGTSGRGAHGDFEFVAIPSIVETAKIYAEIAMRMPKA